MTRVVIWDLPTRVFHLLFATSWLGATGIALLVDDSHPRFEIHMLLGLVVAFLMVFRMVWGIVGTAHARFGSFTFGPGALLGYLREVVRGTDEHYPGHNPGAAYTIYAMLVLAVGLALSGVLMPTWKPLEETHEFMAYLMMLTVAIHLVGLVRHTIQHRENIALGMISGKKLAEPSQAIASPRPLAALSFLVLAAAWVFVVFDGHDAQRRQVTVFGQTIRLGETEWDKSDANARGEGHGKSHKGDGHHEHRSRHHGDQD